MERTWHSLIVIIAVAALSGCTRANERPESSAPDATESEVSSTRFQALWTETAELMQGQSFSEAGPTNADEANEAVGVDESSPLHYVDMSATRNGGTWCMESDDDTYVAMVYGEGESSILMGDGECTYKPAHAVVVGDFMAATWTRGDNLMGDVTASPDA